MVANFDKMSSNLPIDKRVSLVILLSHDRLHIRKAGGQENTGNRSGICGRRPLPFCSPISRTVQVRTDDATYHRSSLELAQ